MPSWLMLAVSLVLMVAFLVAFVWLVRVMSRKVDRAWSAAAEILGLNYEPGRERRIQGRLDGQDIVVTASRGGRLSTGGVRLQLSWDSCTRIRIAFAEPLRLGLHVSGVTLRSGLRRLFGRGDIQVGDAKFDRALVVQGEDPARVKSFLTSDRRAGILEEMANNDDLVIDDKGLATEHDGWAIHEEGLVDVIRRTSELATQLVGSGQLPIPCR